jgi:uncharacterized protein YoxC
MTWEKEEQILSRVNLVLAKEQQLLSIVERLNFNQLLQDIGQLKSNLQVITSDISALVTAVSNISQSLGAQLTTLNSNIQQQFVTQEQTLVNIGQQVSQILKALVPTAAVSCVGTITLDQPIGDTGDSMNKKLAAKVAGDLAVADNGTFTGTLAFKDSLGETTAVPAGLVVTNTSSDSTPGPSIFNLVTPGPSGDQSTFAGSVNQTTVAALVAAGTALPTALTISFSATWTGLAAPVTGTYAPNLDVVPGPAATAVAVISEP